MVGYLRLIISHVSFLGLGVCMLDVYSTERRYNMDWLVMIVVLELVWNLLGRKGEDEWRGVGESLMDIFISKGYLLWGQK
jgi:hypothetical protein